MKPRVLSGMIGLGAVAVAIYLESNGHPVAAQVFLLSVFAALAPFAAAMVMGRQFQRAWFWVSLLATVSLHGMFLWRVWDKLPFSKTPVAIVFGFIECVVLMVVCAFIRQWMSSNQSNPREKYDVD